MVLSAGYGSIRSGELAGPRRHQLDLLHRTIRTEEQAVELAGGKVVFGELKTATDRRTVASRSSSHHCSRRTCPNVGPETDALVFTSAEDHPLRRTKFRPP
jgi:hypothetical protein